MPFAGQPLVGVVGAQRQPVFGARGEHAVRLGDAARDQIVDHHAEIAFGAVEHDLAAPARPRRGVEPRDQALGGGLFVAGRAVDLAGQEQPAQRAWSPASAAARADRRGRIRWHSPAGPCAPVRAPEWSRPARAAPPPAARSRCRSDRPWCRRGPPAPGKSDGRRARRSARSCPRSTGNSAARGSAIWPEYIGERCTLARMIACVAAVVRVMPHWICGFVDALGQRRERLRRLVAGLHLEAAQSMVRPSSRGGVPVLSRPSAKPSRSSVPRKPKRRRLADPAGRDLPLADMDQAAQERAGGQHHRAGAQARGHRPAARRDHAPVGDQQIVGLALDHGQIRRSRGSPRCIAAA